MSHRSSEYMAPEVGHAASMVYGGSSRGQLEDAKPDAQRRANLDEGVHINTQENMGVPQGLMPQEVHLLSLFDDSINSRESEKMTSKTPFGPNSIMEWIISGNDATTFLTTQFALDFKIEWHVVEGSYNDHAMSDWHLMGRRWYGIGAQSKTCELIDQIFLDTASGKQIAELLSLDVEGAVYSHVFNNPLCQTENKRADNALLPDTHQRLIYDITNDFGNTGFGVWGPNGSFDGSLKLMSKIAHTEKKPQWNTIPFGSNAGLNVCQTTHQVPFPHDLFERRTFVKAQSNLRLRVRITNNPVLRQFLVSPAGKGYIGTHTVNPALPTSMVSGIQYPHCIVVGKVTDIRLQIRALTTTGNWFTNFCQPVTHGYKPDMHLTRHAGTLIQRSVPWVPTGAGANDVPTFHEMILSTDGKVSNVYNVEGTMQAILHLYFLKSDQVPFPHGVTIGVADDSDNIGHFAMEIILRNSPVANVVALTIGGRRTGEPVEFENRLGETDVAARGSNYKRYITRRHRENYERDSSAGRCMPEAATCMTGDELEKFIDSLAHSYGAVLFTPGQVTVDALLTSGIKDAPVAPLVANGTDARKTNVEFLKQFMRHQKQSPEIFIPHQMKVQSVCQRPRNGNTIFHYVRYPVPEHVWLTPPIPLTNDYKHASDTTLPNNFAALLQLTGNRTDGTSLQHLLNIQSLDTVGMSFAETTGQQTINVTELQRGQDSRQ